MENYSRYQQRLSEINAVLAKAGEEEEEIDINADDWLEQLSNQADTSDDSYNEEINTILLEVFDASNKIEVLTVIKDVAELTYLIEKIGIPITSISPPNMKGEIKNALKLQIIKYFGADGRDVNRYFSDLISLAKKNNIDYKALIKEVYDKANPEKNNYFLSMKAFLEQILNDLA